MSEYAVLKHRLGSLTDDVYNLSASMAYTPPGDYPRLPELPKLQELFPQQWIEECRLPIHGINQDQDIETLNKRQKLLLDGTCCANEQNLVFMVTLGNARRLSDTGTEPIGTFGEIPAHLQEMMSASKWISGMSNSLFPVRPFRDALVGYARTETFIPGSLLAIGTTGERAEFPSFMNLDLLRAQFQQQALPALASILRHDSFEYIRSGFGTEQTAQESSLVLEYFAHEAGHFYREFISILPGTWAEAPMAHVLEEFRADLHFPIDATYDEHEKILLTRILLRLGLDIGRPNEFDIDVLTARLWCKTLVESGVLEQNTDQSVTIHKEKIPKFIEHCTKIEQQITDELIDLLKQDSKLIANPIEKLDDYLSSESVFQAFRLAAQKYQVNGLR